MRATPAVHGVRVRDVATLAHHIRFPSSTLFARTMPAVIGKPAPAFTANAVQPDGSFKPVKLSDYKGALPGASASLLPR